MHKDDVPPSKRIYLVSTAGLPNFGDEFITRAWLQYLAKRRPNDEIWLDCSNPSHAASLFDGIHDNLHIVNTLWQLVWNTSQPIQDLTSAKNRIANWLRFGGTPREDLGIDILKSSDSIHFLGGGYINQLWKANVLLLAAAATIKKDNPSVALYGTGLGLYPMEGDALSILRSSGEQFNYLSVRDVNSHKLVSSSLTCDDAFLSVGSSIFLQSTSNVPGRAFVCLQRDVIDVDDSTIPLVVQGLLNSGIPEDDLLTIVEAIPPDDAWSIDLFRKTWKGEVHLLPFTHLWQDGFPIAENTVWASSRFHMHLIAAATGSSGMAIEFGNQYYNTKHQSLIDLGTGWSTLDSTKPAIHTVTHATKSTDFPSISKEMHKIKMNEASNLYQ